MIRTLLIALLLLIPFAVDAADLPKGTPDLIDFESMVPSEEGLIRIDVSGIASDDFLARFVGDTLFLPFIPFCDFLRIRSDVSPDLSTLTAVMSVTDTIELSRIRSLVHSPSEDFSVPPTAFRVVEGQIYVEQSVMARAIGMTAYYDAPNLRLRIAPDDKLPLVQWHKAQGRYGSLGAAARAGADAETPLTVDRQLFSGVSVNWTLSNTLNPGLSRSTVGLFSIGQQLLYGTLQVDAVGSLRSGVEGMENRPEMRIEGASWMYQAPSSSIMTRLRLGTLQLEHKKVQGIELTNTPVTPRTGYGTYLLTGQTQPSWTVELYDANHLVDVTRADSSGRYSFRIPMGYGTVDRVTRAVGPFGETEFREHRMQLDQGMVPAGELEYTIQAGADSLSNSTSGEGAASMKVGIIDNLTLGAEVDYRAQDIRSWEPDSIFPSAFASVWLGGSTTLGARYNVRSKLIGGGFYTLLSDNTMLQLTLDSLSPAKGTYAAGAAANLPIGPISIGGAGRYERREGTDAYAIEPQISGHVADIGFVGSTRFVWYGENNMGETGILDPRLSIGRSIISTLQLTTTPFGGLFLSTQGQYDHAERKFIGFGVSTYYRLSRYFGLNLGYSVPGTEWTKGTIQAQVSFDLRPFRASILTTYQQGQVSAASLAQGSALISSRGLTLFAETAVGQSAILLEAFHDRNQNGVRDPGEESMEPPVAWLDIGGTEMSGEEGIFRSLPANRQCRLTVDRWSYGDEELYPSRSSFDIYTLPSGVQVIDIPVAPGIDLTGTCVVDEGNGKKGTPSFVNGLRVLMVSTANDAVYEGEVFSDGTIFVPGVSTGEYRMTFEEDQLASRRLCLSDSEIHITVSEGNDRIPPVTFKKCMR